jgi:hypothetical protein
VARSTNKTVRFTRVVERSGRPHVHTLWVAPDKDPEFKRARETNRVMTLEQSPGGGKADFGLIGFDEKHAAGGQFLIFPKSLKRFEGARVIGVKFDLIEQPELKPAKATKHAAPTRAKSSRRTAKPKPLRLVLPRTRSASSQPRVPAASRARAHPHRQAHNVVSFEPATPAEPKPKPAAEAKTARARTPAITRDALIREVRAAVKELERGKYVAAHQRLQRALP